MREIHATLSPADGTGYTTILKLLQIMHAKGLATRDESSRTHVYGAACSADEVESQVLARVLNKVFSGSAERLVLRAISSRTVPAEELRRIRRFLDTYERQRTSAKREGR